MAITGSTHQRTIERGQPATVRKAGDAALLLRFFSRVQANAMGSPVAHDNHDRRNGASC